MDHKVFEGVIPPEEAIPDPVEESHLASKMDTIVNVPKESVTRETPLELAQERKCPKFPRWEKVPASISAGGNCWKASSPFQEPRADLSA